MVKQTIKVKRLIKKYSNSGVSPAFIEKWEKQGLFDEAQF